MSIATVRYILNWLSKYGLTLDGTTAEFTNDLSGTLSGEFDIEQTGDVTLTGDITQTGDTDITGDVTIDGALSSTDTPPAIRKRITITASGEGTYTGTVPIPAGYTVVDAILASIVVWDSATSASLKAGDDDDDDGYFTATNLKSAPTVGSPYHFGEYGTNAGAYKGIGKAYAAANNFIVVVAAVGAGSAGRTVVDVIMVPTADAVAAATKA